MEINLHILDQDVALTFSSDLTPERLVKCLALVQKNILDDYFKGDRKKIIIDVARMLQGNEPEDPRPKGLDDFSVKGLFQW